MCIMQNMPNADLKKAEFFYQGNKILAKKLKSRPDKTQEQPKCRLFGQYKNRPPI